MPTAILTFMPGNELPAVELARAIPELTAEYLNVEGAERHEGGVTEAEVIVRVVTGSEWDKNAPDINVHIRAHNFPERVKNGQERACAIHDVLRNHLNCAYGAGVSFSAELDLSDLGYKASYPNRQPK